MVRRDGWSDASLTLAAALAGFGVAAQPTGHPWFAESRIWAMFRPMAILKIARLGHPILYRRADPVKDPAAPALRRLIADMIETLEDAGGVGLAAPQVHVSLRLFLYRVPEQRASHGEGARSLSVVINPEIVERSAETEDGWEGCLSIPGLTALVPRAVRIVLRGTDAAGDAFSRPAAGFHARVIQHEADHLDGILYPSRLADPRTMGFSEEMARYGEDIAESLRQTAGDATRDAAMHIGAVR